MKAVCLDRLGPPGVLRPSERNIPAPNATGVLIKVAASGVCGQDLLFRRGMFGGPTGKVMGHEVSGTVAAIGSRVESLQPGERVAALQRRSCNRCRYCIGGREVLCCEGKLYGQDLDGGYAEYAVVEERSLVRVPDGVNDGAAAIAACAVGTAYHALRLAGLEAGQRILVTGASGGVGIHALLLARAMGAEVVAVTSSADKERSLSQFADHVLVSQDNEFHDEVRGSGLAPDVVIDLTARFTLSSSLRSVRRGGVAVVLGNMGSGEVPVLPGALIEREITLLGSKACSRIELQDVLRLIERKVLSPMIHAMLPLERAADAHALVERRNLAGRVVLLP